MAIGRPLNYINLKLQFSTSQKGSQAAEIVILRLFKERYTIIPPFIVLTKTCVLLFMHAQIIPCGQPFSNTLRLMSFCDALSHTCTQLYALTYMLHFIMWTLQVLRDGQYSTQPLEWIMHGPERNTCRLMTELQPGESTGFLRPCGKNITSHNLLITENCPSDWTDHETAHKCKAYALYSLLPLNVSNKQICLQFTS